MSKTTREDLMQWFAEMEQRVSAIEQAFAAMSLLDEHTAENVGIEASLIRKHGLHVDKTVAAQLLGVTRATVYVMLEDGRIKGACGGRRVDVRSIGEYLTKPDGFKRKAGGKHED